MAIKRTADLLKFNRDVDVLYINRRISKALAVFLLQRFPRLRRIYVPPSLLARTSRRVIEALAAVGVEVLPTRRGRGRPLKYDEATRKKIVSLARDGHTPRNIAEQLGIPLRSVYYILRREGYK